VVTGAGGVVLTSPDSKTWTEEKAGKGESLLGVAYGKGGYVAVGFGGVILTSPDGKVWTERTAKTRLSLRGVAYGKEGYVAVGDMGMILTSPDGADWTKRELDIENKMVGLAGITFGSGGYVAVGDSGTILTSDDGVKWQAVAPTTLNDLKSVVFCDNRYITTGALETPERSRKVHRRVYTSPDGKTWSSMTMSETMVLTGVACAKDHTLVVVGKKIMQSDPLPVSTN
jgi:photosystem II stability/assembly factor-like uncharacterized protein